MGKKKKKGKLIENNTLIHMGKKVLVDLDGTKSTYQVYSFHEESFKCIFTDKFPPGTSFTDENNNMFMIFPKKDLYKYDVIDNVILIEKEKKTPKTTKASSKTIDVSDYNEKKAVVKPEKRVEISNKPTANIKKPLKKLVKIRMKNLKTVRKLYHQQGDEPEQAPSDTHRLTENNICDVSYKDFLIKQSTFKCKNKNHHTIDVTANVLVMGIEPGNTDKKVIRISAGYCRECNVYFILESGYRKIRDYGIPMCRVTDEKNYEQHSCLNDLNLSPESILKQYGYNVSQDDNLQDDVRHKVLASLIDNRIMGKPDVISYLDQFISLRKNQDKFEIAISKWERDRDFVNNYHLGDYEQYGIRGLYRSHD